METPLTVRIPTPAGNTAKDAPSYFDPKNESTYSFTRNGSQYLASPTSLASPMMTPLPQSTLSSQGAGRNNKRISEYEFPATAIKVDSPYQSYLNHPYTQQKNLTQLQRPQAYVSKYNSYTNSSKSIRLITTTNLQQYPPTTTSALSSIEKEKMAAAMDLNSPNGLVSPPPPYLHSEHGVAAAVSAALSGDIKQQPQQAYPVQWPSMMKLSSTGATTATVTRPKLARILPPQAIPIMTSGPGLDHYPSGGPSSADAAPLTASTSRVSRLLESETETLYNLQMSEDAQFQHSTTLRMGTRSATRLHSFSGWSSLSAPPSSTTFPGFWEDAREQKMHWVFLSFGCVVLGSGIWALAMQMFLLQWATIMPAATVSLLLMQFGRYRWKKSRFLKGQRKDQKKRQQEEEEEVEQESQPRLSAAAAYAAAAATAAQACSREPSSFLEPHQPRSFYNDQPQQQQEHQVPFQQQMPVAPQQQFNQQSYKQPRLSQQALPKKQQQTTPTLSVNPTLARSVPNYRLHQHQQHHHLLSPIDSPQTPPPAYFLNRRMELPEMKNVVGDLVSEFEIDLSAIKY